MEPLRALFREAAQFLAAIIMPAIRSLRQNSGLAVLSVVLAFGLWIVVTDAENPVRTRVLPVDIPVSAVDLPADLAIAEDLSPVRVRIRVEDNVFESLTAADFEATVDLDGLSVGDYELPVRVRPLTTRGGLRMEDVLPAKIDVKLVQLAGKSVPINVEIRGEPPADFVMASPVIQDSSADVLGPSAKVSRVSQVVASVDVSGRTEPIDQAVRLQPRDQNGVLVSGVTVEPSFTQVRLDIRQSVYRRALVVSPQIVGTPADGYNVVGIDVQPSVVTVTGSRAYIEQATAIRTQPLDIDGAKEDIVRSVSLDVPSGVEVLGGLNVTVAVNVAPAYGQFAMAVPVSVTGVSSGLTIGGSLPSVVVMLYGPLPDLLALEPGDIGAVIDLKDQGAGVHKAKVKVTAPSGVEVRSVSPEEVEVLLEKR